MKKSKLTDQQIACAGPCDIAAMSFPDNCVNKASLAASSSSRCCSESSESATRLTFAASPFAFVSESDDSLRCWHPITSTVAVRQVPNVKVVRVIRLMIQFPSGK